MTETAYHSGKRIDPDTGLSAYAFSGDGGPRASQDLRSPALSTEDVGRATDSDAMNATIPVTGAGDRTKLRARHSAN